MEPRQLISEAGIPIVSDYGRPREFTARDLRNLLRRQAYVRVPYNTASSNGAPRRLVVYAKTPNGWREMSRDRLNQAMLMRGPKQNQSLFSTVFVDGLGMDKNAQYENLKKQLLTAYERQRRVQESLPESDEVEQLRAFVEQEREIFEGDNEARAKDLTGMYKQPNQGAYAIVVRLPRGMSVPDLFKPITEPLTRPVAFEPSAEAVQSMVEEAIDRAEKEQPPLVVQETFDFEPEKERYEDAGPPSYDTVEPAEVPNDEPPAYAPPAMPSAPPLPSAPPTTFASGYQPPVKQRLDVAVGPGTDIKSEDLMLAEEVPPPPPRAPRVTFEDKPDFLTVLRQKINPDQVRNYRDDESSSSFPVDE